MHNITRGKEVVKRGKGTRQKRSGRRKQPARIHFYNAFPTPGRRDWVIEDGPGNGFTTFLITHDIFVWSRAGEIWYFGRIISSMFQPPGHAYCSVRFLHLQGLGQELIPALWKVVLSPPVKDRTYILSNNRQSSYLLSQWTRLNCQYYNKNGIVLSL